ncbi:hypothetical protein RB601_005456 [Gaeumannomyces tritici]
MANFKGHDHEGLQIVDRHDGLQVLQMEKEPYTPGQVAVSPSHHAESETVGTWHQSSPVAEARHRESARILGLRRPTFWLLVSNVVLAIALIVVGVVPAQMNRKIEGGSGASGIAQGPAGGCSTSSNTTTTSSTTSAPVQPTALSQPDSNSPKVCFSTTTPLAPGADPAIPPGIECPVPAGRANYTVPGTGLTFQKLCGTDFGGNDMGRFPVRGMDDCLALCAQLNLFPASEAGRCVGATWVYGDGPQGAGVSFCFPKNDTSRASQRAGTESARLLL